MLGEQRDVVGAIAQRRHEDRNDVQAEVEILAEAAAADLAGQFLVGRRQHADVDPDARRAADRLDHLLLQRAQDLRLRLQAHVANLVEEQRAAVGQLELAAAIGDGAGERALARGRTARSRSAPRGSRRSSPRRTVRRAGG